METVIKKAWNPITNEEYEIEMPAPQVIQEALLEINFPSGGILKKKIAEMLAERFSLTDEQRDAKFRGGKNGVLVFNFHLDNVIHTLKKLGKLVEPKNGWADINPDQVGEQVRVIEQDSADSGNTTEESIEVNYQQIRKELAEELLQQIKDNSPAFFEELVIDLLIAMGYGGY